MNLDRVTSGRGLPNDFNVIIEIPKRGDPVDVLVITPFPLITGGVMPIDMACNLYREIESPRDLPETTLAQISHFFQHYQDLEAGKWGKLDGWVGAEEAKAEILAGVKRYQDASDKPMF